jgi:hypothetical protein
MAIRFDPGKSHGWAPRSLADERNHPGRRALSAHCADAWRIAGTADFNRDGDSDVMWQNSSTGQRAIWLMDQTTWVGERFLPVIPIAWDMRNR